MKKFSRRVSEKRGILFFFEKYPFPRNHCFTVFSYFERPERFLIWHSLFLFALIQTKRKWNLKKKKNAQNNWGSKKKTTERDRKKGTLISVFLSPFSSLECFLYVQSQKNNRIYHVTQLFPFAWESLFFFFCLRVRKIIKNKKK